MQECVSVSEIIAATGLSASSVSRLVKGMPKIKCEPNGPGKPVNWYRLNLLSDRIQLKINLYRGNQSNNAESAECKALVKAGGKALARRTAVIGGKEVELPSWDGLSQKQIDFAMARSRLVERYREHCGKAEGKGQKLAAKKQFIVRYNDGALGTYPELYAEIGQISFQNLERWDLLLKRSNNDGFVLADARGKYRKGHRDVSDAQGELLVRCALNPNRPLISEVIRQARTRMEEEGIACQVSDDTLRRWLMDWKSRNLPTWIAVREGEKAVNDKLLPHIRRDYNRIEVGDVVFCDGHTFNLGAQWTPGGKEVRLALITWFDMKSSMPLGWEISLTENTQSIATALYRAILFLGKIPRVAYLDNGKAFRSRYFNGQDIRKTPVAGTFQLLGMEKMFAWAYHGETKTVERWHRTLGEFEREITTYTGTCIEDKPARMLRGEKLHRKLWQLATSGRIPTVEDLHEMLADWIDRYSLRPSKGHLKGKTPKEVFDAGKGPGLVEPEAVRLKLLLSQVAVRSISRDGIKMVWSDERYYHPDLYGRAGESCVVRYDDLNRDTIWVHDLENNFICEAKRIHAVHPTARILGNEEDKAELERQLHLRGTLAKQTFGSARELVKDVVLPEVRRRIESQAPEPVIRPGERLRVVRVDEVKPTMTPEEEAAIWEGVERDREELRQERERQRILEEEAAARAREVEAIFGAGRDSEEAAPDPYVLEQEAEDFERAKAFLAGEVAKEDPKPGEQSWFVEYLRTDAGKKRKAELDEYHVNLILASYETMPGA